MESLPSENSVLDHGTMLKSCKWRQAVPPPLIACTGFAHPSGNCWQPSENGEDAFKKKPKGMTSSELQLREGI